MTRASALERVRIAHVADAAHGQDELGHGVVSLDGTPPLVLHVGVGRALSVNGSELALEELAPRLKRMLAAREDHILFFDASDDASYGFTVEVMDQAREGGAVTIATLTSALGGQPPSPPSPASP